MNPTPEYTQGNTSAYSRIENGRPVTVKTARYWNVRYEGVDYRVRITEHADGTVERAAWVQFDYTRSLPVPDAILAGVPS